MISGANLMLNMYRNIGGLKNEKLDTPYFAVF